MNFRMLLSIFSAKVRASTITIVARPDAGNPAPQGEEKKKEGKSRNKKNLRCAGGQIWEDHSLNEWDHGECPSVCLNEFGHLCFGKQIVSVNFYCEFSLCS